VRWPILLIALAGLFVMTGCLFGGHSKPKQVFDVSLGVSPQSLTIPAGGSAAATVDITPSSDNNCGLVQLSVATAGGPPLPNLLHITLSPSQPVLSQKAVQAAMTVAADVSAPAGTLNVLVMGTCKDFTAPAVQFNLGLTVPGQGPAPTITSLSPSTILAGGPSFTLTVNGSTFISASAVNWNGSQLTTAFVSATQLTAQVPMADIANPGTATVTVVGPGTSNAITLTIIPPSSAGVVAVISERDGANLANGIPNPIIALSADGRYAAFENQNATNLVSNPTVSQSIDAYFHDSCLAGQVSGCSLLTRLASVMNGFSGNGGNDGNGPSISQQARKGVSISGDGRFVVFLSQATNLTSTNANNEEAYIRDTCTGVAAGCTPSTAMVSLTDNGAEPNNAAIEATISTSGGFVAFSSFGTNLVANPVPPGQAYLRNMKSGCAPTQCTVLVSVDSNGNPFASGAGNIAVSANGRFVIFDAIPATQQEVFVRDTCFNAPGSCQPSTTTVSLDNNGNPAPTGAFGASISDDGRVIAFFSSDQLAPNSLSAPSSNLYLRDTCQTESGPVSNCTPATTTASVAFDGNTANAGLAEDPFGNSNPHRLSGTGRFVAFASNATNLVAGGTPAGGAFVHDTCIGVASGCTPTTVLVSFDSTGVFVTGSAPVISSDGHYCGFMVLSDTSPELAQEQAVLARTGL
jgi:hypothetical protein